MRAGVFCSVRSEGKALNMFVPLRLIRVLTSKSEKLALERLVDRMAGQGRPFGRHDTAGYTPSGLVRESCPDLPDAPDLNLGQK